MNWYNISVPGYGSIMIRADWPGKAMQEAERRMDAPEDAMRRAVCRFAGTYDAKKEAGR